jgi:hypothetical protein
MCLIAIPSQQAGDRTAAPWLTFVGIEEEPEAADTKDLWHSLLHSRPGVRTPSTGR